MDLSKRTGPNAVGWETEAEWLLEQRASHWNEDWGVEETRALINDLWLQYCLAADPNRSHSLTHNPQCTIT